MHRATIPFALTLLVVGAWAAPFDAASTGAGPLRVLEEAASESLPGAVRPRREVILGSPFDTLLSEVRVREGDTVRAGDVIAVLDDRVVRASLRLAEQEAARTARVDRAKAALEDAAFTLSRLEAAVASSAVSSKELTEARSDHEIALADLREAEEAHQQAKIQEELARAKVEEVIVRAPFDAIVIRTHIEAGAILSPGDPIVELFSLDETCVDLHLPAAIAMTLRVDERIALRVEEASVSVRAARVRYVEPRIDPVSRTVRVVFDFEPGDQPVMVGAIARPADRLPGEDPAVAAAPIGP